MILSSIAIVFAAITEIVPSGSITFYVPEGVYLTPSDNGSTTNTAAQYYMNNNNASGAYTQSATETTGRIYFNSANATSVSITYSFGTTGTVSGTLSSSSGKLSEEIKISAGNTNQLLTWTATYKCRDGATRVATAHTYIYVPNKYPTGAGFDVGSGKNKQCYIGGLQVVWGANLSGTGSYGVYDAAKLNGAGLTTANNQQPTNSGHISTNYNPKYVNYEHHVTSNNASSPISETAPVAYYYVDSSRFSNTNQVPNFRFGLTMTDDERTVNTGLILKLEDSTGTSVFAKYVDKNPASDVNDTNAICNEEKVLYSFSGSGALCGSLSPSIAMSSITANGAASYRFHSYFHGNGQKNQGDCYVNVFSPFTVYNVNKATLRNYYYKTCIANSYQNQQEKFTSSTWSTYVTRLKSAGTVLGNPAASSAEVTNAYNNLKTAYEALAVEKHTASARYVALNHQGTIGYAVKALATSKATSESITYTGASNVKFENSFDGYKIYGYKANQSDVIGTTSYSSGLSGFTTLNSNSLTLYRADGNKAYTFYYIPYDYTITLDANGATQGGDASIMLSYGDNFYKDTKYINKMSVDMNNVTVPSRTGYIFDGFYDASTGGTQMIGKTGYLTANASVTAYTSNTIWYAHWIPISYTINYIGNGATSGTMASSVHEYGTAKGLSTNEYKRTGYTFSGWSTSSTGSAVYPNGRSVLNLTVTDGDEIDLYAVWTVNQYTIIYNGNGSTGGSTASTVCTYGQSFKMASNGFEKTGYVFKGWATEPDGEVVYSAGQKIEESLTEEAGKVILLYAVWQPTQHLIKFVNYDGDVLQSALTAYGSMPVYGGATPTKPSTESEDFTFAGWSPEVSTVTGEKVYTAQFISSARKYTVEFVNEDGTVLQSSEVPYGTVPTYDGKMPTKKSDAQNEYSFAGWNKEIVAVTENATYTAKFNAGVNSYLVIFKNSDGSVLQQEEVAYGTMPVYNKEMPTKFEDEHYTYAFAGWSPKVSAVKGYTEYVAQFDAIPKKFDVTFKNWDGTVLKTVSVDYNTTPVYDDIPTKAATESITYTFKGWDKKIMPCAGAGEVYTAEFTESARMYKISFVNSNGKLIWAKDFAYNTMPEFDESYTPTRDSDAQYSYVFDGWTQELTSVTCDKTYTAKYREQLRQYTVKFVNYDGTELYSAVVDYGTVPSYNGPDPQREGDKAYVYTFIGWNQTPKAVTGNITYTAIFGASYRKYNISFYNYDGTLLQTVSTAYSKTASYTGTTPVKPSDTEWDYTFAGWNTEIAKCTKDAEYTAVYTKTARKYTITFADEDGTVLYTKDFAYGTTPSCSLVPTKASTDEFEYTFANWGDITPVDGEKTYKAVYSESKRTYHVTFLDEDGTKLFEQDVEYGEYAKYGGEEPTKEADEQHEYYFNGWDKDFHPIQGEETYTATYSDSTRKYCITFLDGDLNPVQSAYFYYGDTPVYSGATPTKEKTAQYTFTFNGKWDKELATVTGDAVYTAQFDAELNSYEIKFLNYDGTLLETKSVDYGVTPSYNNAEPEKPNDETYSYVFKGWSPELTAVTGNAEYTAQYEQINLSYIISFVNEDGTLIKSTRVFAGEKPVYDGDEPTKASTAEFDYTFAGWDREFAEADEATTYTATYNAIRRSYDIKFLNYDGTLLKTQSVEYGTDPVYEGETPIKASTISRDFTFAGWSPEISAVTGSRTYKAQFSETARKYTVRFVNDDGTVLQETENEYGTKPVYTLEKPEKAATVSDTFAFAGWTPKIETVTCDITYTATYSKTTVYTVTFVDYNSDVLYSTKLVYGSYPTYGGKVPTRAADDDYVYTFSGWDKSFARITADTTFTAKYSTIANSFTVKFVDENGNTIQSKNYKLGEMPAFDGTPTKDCTDKVHYTFTGWDKEITAVTGFTAYKAVFAVEEHTLAYSETKEPTCTEGGKTVYVCSDCGYMTVVETSATGHKLGETVIDGDRAYKECSVCGEQVEVELEEAQYQNNLCKYCGKYHYKYIRPDFGWLSCFISRLFDMFAEIAKKLA